MQHGYKMYRNTSVVITEKPTTNAKNSTTQKVHNMQKTVTENNEETHNQHTKQQNKKRLILLL